MAGNRPEAISVCGQMSEYANASQVKVWAEYFYLPVREFFVVVRSLRDFHDLELETPSHPNSA